MSGETYTNTSAPMVESNEKTDFRINLLNEDNYVTWKWQIEMILESKGMLECITGSCRDAIKNRQAKILIASTLSQLNMQRVINCQTAKEIWTSLESIFENRSSSQRTMLLEKFTSFKIHSTRDVSKAIGELQALAAKLKTLKVTIDDELIISVLLKALPNNMRNWSNTWKLVNAENPTLNGLITAVMAEINSMKNPEGTAYFVKKGSNNFRGKRQGQRGKFAKHQESGNQQNPGESNRHLGNQGNSNKRNDTVCHYCKKPGHWIKDCLKKKADDRQSDDRRPIALISCIKNQKADITRAKPAAVECSTSRVKKSKPKKRSAARRNRRGLQKAKIPAEKDDSKDLGPCEYCLKHEFFGESCHNEEECHLKPREYKVEHPLVAYVAMNKKGSKGLENTVWVADSGSSFHMTPTKDWIQTYVEFDHPIGVSLGDDHTIMALGSGNIWTDFGKLTEVYYVPDLSVNLLSISAITMLGYEAVYNKNGIEIRKNGKIQLTGGRSMGIFLLNIRVTPRAGSALTALSIEEWHKRFGHISANTIRDMAKGKVVDGLKIKVGSESMHQCVDCALNKCTKANHKARSSQKTTTPGSLLHFDTAGPFKPESLGEAKYMLVCKDEASSYRIVKFMQVKREIPDQVKQIISQAELETGNKVLGIMTDNGTEFKTLDAYLKDRGIIHRYSVPYTPQQNGFIEREIRNIIEAGRAMIGAAKVPLKLWAEAADTAVYTLNRATNKRHPTVTPYELWFKKKPNVANLRVFGQRAIVMYRTYNLSKWEDKGIEQIFVGYTDRSNTYRFYDVESDDVFTSCHATFLENKESQEPVASEQESVEVKIGMRDTQNENNAIHEWQNSTQIGETGYQSQFDMSWDDDGLGQRDLDLTRSDEEGRPAQVVEPDNGPISIIELAKDADDSVSNREPHGASTELVARSDLAYDGNKKQSNVTNNRQGILAKSTGGSGNMSRTSLINKSRVSFNVPPPMSSTSSMASRGASKTIAKKVVRKDHLKSLDDKYKPSDIHPANIISSKLRSKGAQEAIADRTHAKVATIQEQEPRSYIEAMGRPDKDKWLAAMKEELSSLKHNHVYEVVDRPTGNVVTNKWVLKIKKKADGTIDRYKARLVARGFSQIYGIDYTETYAPVVNMVSIRMLFAQAAMKQLKMAQFDVKTAFLYGNLDETVYMEQPEGFYTDRTKVWLLRKSLYGLKQSPRQWNKKFTDFLKEKDLTASEHDSCVFYRKQPLLYLAIYVDDGIIFAQEESEIKVIMDQLSSKFQIHKLSLESFLGFQVYRGTRGEIMLHQESYIKEMLRKFNMVETKSVGSPIAPEKIIDPNTRPLKSDVPYREAIGSLMYAAVTTRIDIAYAVNKAARKVENPSEEDWSAVKRIFRYLKGREKYALVYRQTKFQEMIVYCDADFAGDTDSYKSTTGSVFILGGAPIQWKSQRQNLISLSSTEAEFVSLCSTVKETVWIRKLARELGIFGNKATVVRCDNQSAIKIASNEKSMHRTRHMGVQASYPREQQELGEIEVVYEKAEDQIADILTKPTTISKFTENLKKIMLLLISLCLLIPGQVSSEYIFERINSVIWIPTHHQVEANTTTFVLELTYQSPCNSLETYRKKGASLEGLDKLRSYMSIRNMQQELLNKCYASYNQQWVNKLARLTEKDDDKILQDVLNVLDPKSNVEIRSEAINVDQRNSTTLIRKKRFIPMILFGGTLFFGGALITNLLSAGLSEIIPWGDGYRIRNLQSQTMIDQARIDALTSKVDQVTLIQKGIDKNILELRKMIEENRAAIRTVNAAIPAVAWASAYVQVRISEASHHLDELILSRQKDRLNTYHLGELFNTTEFLNMREEDTNIEYIKRLSPSTLVLKFTLKRRSRDTKVYEAYGFEHLEPLNSEPGSHWVKLKTYYGPEYLIYNSTSNCARGIEKPGLGTVLDHCEERDKIEKRLNRWSYSMHDDRVIRLRPHYKSTTRFNYVQCYGNNITIWLENGANETLPCPIFPFRIPVSIGFQCQDLEHRATETRIHINGPNWEVFDVRVPSPVAEPRWSSFQFPDHRLINTQLSFEMIAHKTITGTLIIIVVVMIIAIWKLCRRKKPKKLRKQIIRKKLSEIDSDDSDFTEEEVELTEVETEIEDKKTTEL